jgi:hypothetical protein
MLTMQAFYHQLFDEPVTKDPYLVFMIELARSSLEQLATLKSDLAWDPWDAKV